MTFTPAQVRKLAGKLPERFVKTRTERGMTLSYVEGWHVIDEANRIFGFDGWDRETMSAECVWQDVRISPKACSYAVRVRIKVRAGKTIVAREGTGIGHGTGATLGEAHESALKEAETDATKRALITFGNLFGLALYDKEQAGVQRAKSLEAAVAPVARTLTRSGQSPQPFASPHQFCSAAREAMRLAQSAAELDALWTVNAPTVAQLRTVRPELRTRSGSHYADLLESLYRQQQKALERQGSEPKATAAVADVAVPTADAEPSSEATITSPSTEAPVAPDKSATAIVMPRRIRDAAHLKYVASLPCLVCGRTPSHAHHLRFTQPRSLGSKPSDEWTVPLCPIHHRALHDAGREEEWWQAKGIDAKVEAERLWRRMHTPPADQVPPAPSERTYLKSPPLNGEGEPLPINLHVDAPSHS